MSIADHWHLLAPDFAGLDTIRHSPLPFVLWPVCEKPLLAHWLDEAVRLGVPAVAVSAVDRPHLIRQWLNRRDLWSRSIVVNPPAATPSDSRLMDHLPGGPAAPSLETPEALLRWWFELHSIALHLRSTKTVHLDDEIRPGIWLGPGARVAGDAEIQPPCWIGSYARIGAGCRLGPRAFIGPNSFLDTDVEVEEAMVCADTYVGSHTTLRRSVAQGGLLCDLDRGIAVEVVDDFVMSSLTPSSSKPGWGEKILAALVAPVFEIAAKVLAKGHHPKKETYRIGRDQTVELVTYPAGPLLVRRASWLREVAAGRLRWVGVLPRRTCDWDQLPGDVRPALMGAAVGVLALSDLYDCHSADEPDEWAHALFQTAAPDAAGHRLAHKSRFAIAFKNPSSP